MTEPEEPRWVDLLVSAATHPDSTHVSLPGILSQFEPHDARLPARIANETPAGAEQASGHFMRIADEGERLALANWLAVDATYPGHTSEEETIAVLTLLGRVFHDGCHATGANAK